MYKIGDIVKCVVTGFKDYGIFVKVDDLYDGLIHISEISDAFVRRVTDYGDFGEVIYARIIEINEETKHIKLSIKNINYKIDGNDLTLIDTNGFMPLKNNLNIWINEKLNEIKKI